MRIFSLKDDVCRVNVWWLRLHGHYGDFKCPVFQKARFFKRADIR